MTERTFVIVGAGLAGAKAAEALRERGFDGRLVLIGEEPRRPYERPDLSKHCLVGEKPTEELYVHSSDFYAEQEIELLTGTRVTGLDPGSKSVQLAAGPALRYDALLLATGAAPRGLPVPGAGLPGVVTLRTMEDSEDLQARIRASSHVIVIGVGWIGCEVAAAARTLGADVTMIAPDALPLARVLGAELGAMYRDVHAEHGVRLRLQTGVEAIVGSTEAEGVRTDVGDVVPGDLVVVGIGAAPRIELATAAALTVDDGVLVDEYLRTSDPAIFAAGDVARAWHPRYGKGIRVEHWANALNQGPAAAANMLGEQAAYTKRPYFYSDQYEVGMEYRGYTTSWDGVVLRGDVAAREFLAFWLDGGTVVAGMNVNRWDDGDAIEALLESDGPVDARRLADPDVPLSEV